MVKKSMKTRRRKNLHKDFQKVKLKAGRTLPKGLNVTDASFKSRQIRIREQLVNSNSGEPKSHRQLSITTLLSQLEHYNANIRRDAVHGLQQVVQSLMAANATPIQQSTDKNGVETSSLLQQHLGPMLTRASALVVDRETNVRQAAHRLFQLVLSAVQRRQLAPFFKLIIVHVCCAMTHIEEQIQLDSLKFVDLLVEKYPELVAENSSELLPNFISLIARRAQGPNIKSTLAIDPGLKVHSRKWRTDVLDRLFVVLSVVSDHVDGHVANSASQPGQVDSNVMYVDGGTSVYHPIREELRMCEFRFSKSQSSNHGNVLTQVQKLEEFTSRLIPLLQQSWVECTASLEQNTDADDMLFLTMAAVVKVTALVCRCIQGNEKIITMAIKQGLVSQFMVLFPYEIQERKTKKSEKVSKATMVTLNLGICEIVSHLMCGDRSTWSEDCWQKMIGYMTGLHSVKLEPEIVEKLFKIIRLLLSSGNETVMASAVELVCELYRSQHLPTNQKPHLHDLMLAYVLPNRNLAREKCVVEWLRRLPDQLLLAGQDPVKRRPAVVAPLVSLMAVLAPRNFQTFLLNLQEKLDEVIDVILATPLASRYQRQFVELLYHVKILRRHVVCKLITFCRLAECDVVSYLLDVIYLKMSSKPSYCHRADYLSLILALCVVDTKGTDSADTRSQLRTKHLELVKIVGEKLVLFPNHAQIFKIALTFIQKNLQHSQNVEILSKFSFLVILTSILTEKDRKQEILVSVIRNGRKTLEKTTSLTTELDLNMEEFNIVAELSTAVLVDEEVLEEKEVLLQLLHYGDVYASCLDGIKRNMTSDTAMALDRLCRIVSVTSLHPHVGKNREKIMDILSLNENDGSGSGHETILRRIECELSVV